MVTANAMRNDGGNPGAITMERVGQAITQYQIGGWDYAEGLLPNGWRVILKPWRYPELASVRLEALVPAMSLDPFAWPGWWPEFELPWWPDGPDWPGEPARRAAGGER
jgi:hypothetical protein